MVEREIERLHSILKKRGVAFTNLVSVDDLVEIYDRRSEVDENEKTHYQRQCENNPRRRYMFSLVNKFYHDALASLIRDKEISYLDIGCADGIRTVEFIKTLDGYCTLRLCMGVDISPGMVKNAQKRLGHDNVLVADMCNLPYENKFDLVTCMFGVIGHLPDDLIPAALNSVHNALKQGGLFCIDVEGKDDSLKRWGFTKEDEREGRNRFAYYINDYNGDIIKNEHGVPLIGINRAFTPEEMQRYATNSGFKIVSERSIASEDPKKDFGMSYTMVLEK